jgi:transcriptional regulator with XRE-family HTH domain
LAAGYLYIFETTISYYHTEQNPALDNSLNPTGHKLYLLRHEKRQKKTSVAKDIGISHPAISQIENGRYRALSFQLLCKTVSYYNVPVYEPIGNNAVKKPS